MQGAAKARPFVERAQATCHNLIDSDNRLSILFGFKVLPNVVFLDETGTIFYTNFGCFDIRRPEQRQLAEQFAATPKPNDLRQQAKAAGGLESPAALEHFQQGLALYEAGDTQAALVEWRKGVALEPDNRIIRKQVWAIEHPYRFYEGAVDFDWQKEQITHNL